MRTFVGIDNGVTGSIGIIQGDKNAFIETPVIKFPSYTKKKQFINRIDWCELRDNLPPNSLVLIERPMVNPSAFMATASALRALEATIIVMEMLGLEYIYIDSKEWQSEFISSAIMGHKEMKNASREIGIKLFPNHTTKINKHGDADGILIAEYARRRCG